MDVYKGKFASELSMNDVKEYYDELRERRSLTKEQWADFVILQERLIVFAYKILDSKSNEAAIKAAFNTSCEDCLLLHSDGKVLFRVTEEWWNAPYKPKK